MNYKTSMLTDKPTCDICIDPAQFSITLSNGREFITCRECITVCIQTEASSTNPVHSIEPFDDNVAIATINP